MANSPRRRPGLRISNSSCPAAARDPPAEHHFINNNNKNHKRGGCGSTQPTSGRWDCAGSAPLPPTTLKSRNLPHHQPLERLGRRPNTRERTLQRGHCNRTKGGRMDRRWRLRRWGFILEGPLPTFEDRRKAIGPCDKPNPSRRHYKYNNQIQRVEREQIIRRRGTRD